jgi:hypothetical protein
VFAAAALAGPAATVRALLLEAAAHPGAAGGVRRMLGRLADVCALRAADAGPPLLVAALAALDPRQAAAAAGAVPGELLAGADVWLAAALPLLERAGPADAGAALELLRALPPVPPQLQPRALAALAALYGRRFALSTAVAAALRTLLTATARALAGPELAAGSARSMLAGARVHGAC